MEKRTYYKDIAPADSENLPHLISHVIVYILFYVQERHLLFFHSRGNFPLSRDDLNINSSDLQREASQGFTIKILTMSWPWGLFGSKFLITFRISSFVKRIIDSDSWVFFVKVVWRSVQVFIREHYFAKDVLNISAFLLKSMINLFSYSKVGIQGIFLLFRNIFNIDQYDFGLVTGSNKILDKRA